MKQYMLSVPMIDGAPPRPHDEMQQAFERTAVLNGEMQAEGVWVFGGGLFPASTATVVEAEGDGFLVTDGPFTESKEHIGGFWVIEAEDLDEALAWAKRATLACGERVEVRPFQDNPPL
jgi:hypothetical protein